MFTVTVLGEILERERDIMLEEVVFFFSPSLVCVGCFGWVTEEAIDWDFLERIKGVSWEWYQVKFKKS